MLEHECEQRHQHTGVLGLQAPATAVGLVQLIAELVRAGVLDRAAAERVKEAMAADLLLARPRSAHNDDYERSVRKRLDLLFACPDA